MTPARWILSVTLGLCSIEAAAEEPPNFLVFVADDMTWFDCEPYGNPDVETPSLARLAREGMRFDAMFTSTAMCSPARQQLYTGLWPVRNGAYPNHSQVYAGVRSAPHHLSELGYRVGLVGKKHFGPAEAFPFQKLGAGKRGAANVDRFEEWVEEDSSPYCLFVCVNEPHSPWTKGDASAYEPAELTIPPYLEDTDETRRVLSLYYAEITHADALLGRYLDAVDRSGRAENTMVAFLSEQGSQLVFGGKWTCYDAGLKQACLIRWPARVKPGSSQGALVQTVDLLPTMIEAAGGAVADCRPGRPDAHDEQGFDGRSFLALLEGGAMAHREFVYGVQTSRGIKSGDDYPVRSVRSRRHKLILNLRADELFRNIVTEGKGEKEGRSVFESWREAGGRVAQRSWKYQHRPSVELYDVVADPWERRDLAGAVDMAEVRRALEDELARWMRQQGDEGVETEARAFLRQGKAIDGEPLPKGDDEES